MSLKDTWIDKKNTTTGLDGDDIMAEDINAIAQQAIQNEEDLKNKVEKEDGKGLSSNDFTNELKEKLENISENEGAEQVQDDWNQNDENAPDYIKNRPFHMEYKEDGQHDIELTKEHIVTIDTLGKFARWRIPSTNSTVTQAGIIAGENYQIIVDFEYGKYDLFFGKAFETTYQNNYGTQNKAVAIHFYNRESSETNLIKELYIRDDGSELYAEMRLNDEAQFSIGAYPVVYISLDGKVKLWKATPIKKQHIQDLNKENFNEEFYKSLISGVQSDMEQNNENDPSFIKNRTHYFIKNIIGEAIYTSEGTIPGMFDGICDLRIPKELVEVGKEYGYTINGKEGTFVFNDSYMEIEGLCGDVYDFGDQYDWQFSLGYGESIHVIFYDGGELKQLDDKYIPDSIARVSDVQAMIGTVNDELESILAGGVD